ncbi:MAG: macrolide ABC transporter ATP-binding protein [Crocinitomicaceae bacterium]|nr:macrolide ABC transporter ATP-binding protein [Crocinitomicaceae bacterium]|tara:strand:+ start:9361 stop:10044 length:684 start_codon:yes stop_codon:yes gene_type:complete
MGIIKISDLKKTYNETTIPVHAVNGIDLEFEEGEFAALVGPSGCGKTTFLNMLGGLEQATGGSVEIAGTDLSNLKPAELTEFRLKNIGFVFQAYNLIPVLNAKENIEFIMQLQGHSGVDSEARVDELIEILGIADQKLKRPSEMSGGQQQRVAVARALASKPKFVLADEPTANLDSHSTETLLDLMKKLNEKENTTFIFATHDERVMRKARRIIHMEDGKVLKDERK